jgi:formiminotetrahydrofolate cyclodeaminase
MKLIEQTIGVYSDLLASDFPTPGGGSTAALNGMLGCSFIIKIARITLKKAGAAGDTALLRRIAAQAESRRQELLALIDEDTAAYNGIMAALSRPKGDSLRGALKIAVETPLRILQASLAALDAARSLSENYYAGTASDLALAALNLEAAARGAYLTVRINLNHLSDTCAANSEYVQRHGSESAGQLAEAEGLARSIYDGAKALLERG